MQQPLPAPGSFRRYTADEEIKFDEVRILRAFAQHRFGSPQMVGSAWNILRAG